MVDKITPNDPRITRETVTLNGLQYSYIQALPSGTPSKTIFLIHGWPDLSFGWRYQIPLLTSLNLRVIVPDIMGYGSSSAPSPTSFYTFKRTASDIAALASHLNLSSIILGGHDWGGAIVFRIALWYPELVEAIFSVCTPFSPPRKDFLDAALVLPNFKYQQHLRGPEVEAEVVGKEKIGQFLNGMYGGRSSTNQPFFDPGVGLNLSLLPHIGPSPLLSKEEWEFYVSEYSKNGMHGPLNWYRTNKLNFDDELPLAEKFEKDGLKITVPVLFVAGSRDGALPPSMSKGMEKSFTNFTRAEVDANHWALWEKPAEVNQYIKEFLVGKAGVGEGKANL